MKLTAALVAAAAAALPLAAGARSDSGQLTKHDRDVIRFFLHHPTLAATPAGAKQLWRIVGRVAVDLTSIRREQSARPRHLSLWRCIAGYPGARPDGRTGESGGNPYASNGSHWNVLQMTKPWGEGSYRVDDPAGASADEVIRKAELGYAAHGYASWWLEEQWGQTVGPCLQYG